MKLKNSRAGERAGIDPAIGKEKNLCYSVEMCLILTLNKQANRQKKSQSDIYTLAKNNIISM